MIKNVKMIGKIGGLGLAGVMAFGATQATAETFNATAAVQSALVVTNVADLDLGTLFATSASTTEGAFITFDPDGSVAATGASTGLGLNLLSLSAATPAQASVAVGSQTQFDVTLPAAIQDTLDADAAIALDNGDGTDVVALCAGGACGNTVIPRLYLINFTIGEATGGTIGTAVENVYPVTPSFGSTDVGFNIGVTVTTDTNLASVAGGDRTAFDYEDTTYTGTFEVTASY